MDYLNKNGHIAWAQFRRLRGKALKRAMNRCELCRAHHVIDTEEWRTHVLGGSKFYYSKPIALHAHHTTYERYGKERLSDLLIVCEKCHEAIHGRA